MIVAGMAACVHAPTVTGRSELDQAREAIGQGRHATIQAIDDTSTDTKVPFDLAPEQQIEVTVQGTPTTITLANYYARCQPADGPCDVDTDNWIVVGRTLQPGPDVPTYVVGGAFALGLGACIVACDRPWNFAAGGTLVGVALIALIVHEVHSMTLPIGR